MYRSSGHLKNKMGHVVLLFSLMLGGVGISTLVAPQQVSAATESSNQAQPGDQFPDSGFFYNINDDGKTVTLVSYGEDKFPSDTAVVPKTVSYENKEYAVTVIGTHAMSGFTHNDKLKSVTLPEGLKEIDTSGLEDNDLTTINIPSTVKILKDKALFNDHYAGLTTVTGGEGLTEIGEQAFSGNRLTDISFAKGVSPERVAKGVTSEGDSTGAFTEQNPINKTVQVTSNENMQHMSLSEVLNYPFSSVVIDNLTDNVTYNSTEKSFNIPNGVTSFSFAWHSSDDKYSGSEYDVKLKSSPSDIRVKDFTVALGSKLDPFKGFVKAINSDNSDVAYKNVKVESNSVNTNKVGKYQITYSFIDKDNNEVSRTATVRVVANTPQPTEPAQQGTVTSHYVDQQGKKIANDYVQTGNMGSSYSTTQRNINGYTFSKVDGSSTGTYTNGNTDVTYVYTKNMIGETTPVKKGQVVYAIKKIGLYSTKDFSKNSRKFWYDKKKRTNRPMFVVTGYSYSKNGNLRYKVRALNHQKKQSKLNGYITANKKYVLPVYYSTLPKSKKITVINPKGVNEYNSVGLTGKSSHHKQGETIQVVKIKKHNLTTRYILSNGHYITANKKLIIFVK